MRVPRLGPHPPTGRPSHSAAGTLGSTRLRSRWLGALIVLFGVSSSLFLAAEWRESALAANRNSAASTERDLINTLSSKLDVNLALTRTMRAIATLEPGANETRYIRWYRDLQTEGKASDNVVATLIEPVRQARLAAFRHHAESDPAFRRVLGGRFQILPQVDDPSTASSARSSARPPTSACIPDCSTIAHPPYLKSDARRWGRCSTLQSTPARSLRTSCPDMVAARSSQSALLSTEQRRATRSRRVAPPAPDRSTRPSTAEP